MQIEWFMAAAVILLPSAAFAEEFSVATSSAEYSYGQYLSFTVDIPNVTEDVATFSIIDANGDKSGLVNMQITGSSTTLVAPNPFERYLFDAGVYTLQIDYDGDTMTTEFIVVDHGGAAVPSWIKNDVSGLWLEGIIDDKGFLKNLLDNDVITLDGTVDESTQVRIPSWYKANIQWWREGIISDDEFVNGLQYMIMINAVSVINQ